MTATAAIWRGLGYATGVIPVTHLLTRGNGYLKKGEAHYKDFYNACSRHKELPFGDLPQPVSLNGKITRDTFLVKVDKRKDVLGFEGENFKGVIRVAGNEWDGKVIDTRVRKSTDFTMVLTAVGDAKSIKRKIDGNGNPHNCEEVAQYKLQSDDMPRFDEKTNKADIDGFHFLVTCYRDGKIANQAAVFLRTNNGKVLDEILKETGAECSKSGSAKRALSWISSEGTYCSYGSDDHDGPLFV